MLQLEPTPELASYIVDVLLVHLQVGSNVERVRSSLRAAILSKQAPLTIDPQSPTIQTFLGPRREVRIDLSALDVRGDKAGISVPTELLPADDRTDIPASAIL